MAMISGPLANVMELRLVEGGVEWYASYSVNPNEFTPYALRFQRMRNWEGQSRIAEVVDIKLDDTQRERLLKALTDLPGCRARRMSELSAGLGDGE